jgi:hypothetical protein
MHGQAFLGPRAKAENRYVFAGADRFDEVPEWQRSVHDGRYQYIRNFGAELPFMRPLAFRDVMPTMREMWRLQKAGQLPAQVGQYFTAPRATEELYDLSSDPDTVRNIAGDPHVAPALRRLRTAYRQWAARVGDDSSRPELQMIQEIWPGMKQPATAAPAISISRRGSSRYLRLTSVTKGASIGYRLGPQSPWLLYERPVPVPAGAQVEAKAIRYGYSESSPTRLSAGDRP